MMQHPTLFSHRITLFCGHYGSGKTELSIQTALWLRAAYERVAIVDLDIVNPYFRTAEHAELFAREGIRMLCPTFAGTTVDIPGLPAQIQSVFDMPNERVVFDVGGDDTGAVALGRYKPYFDRDDSAMYFVVNALRPFSATAEDICDLYGRICARARMEAVGIINNTNFGPKTCVQDVLEGQKLLETAGKALGLPVLAVAAMPHIAAQLPPALAADCLVLTPRMRPEWMEE